MQTLSSNKSPPCTIAEVNTLCLLYLGLYPAPLRPKGALTLTSSGPRSHFYKIVGLAYGKLQFSILINFLCGIISLIQWLIVSPVVYTNNKRKLVKDFTLEREPIQKVLSKTQSKQIEKNTFFYSLSGIEKWFWFKMQVWTNLLLCASKDTSGFWKNTQSKEILENKIHTLMSLYNKQHSLPILQILSLLVICIILDSQGASTSYFTVQVLSVCLISSVFIIVRGSQSSAPVKCRIVTITGPTASQDGNSRQGSAPNRRLILMWQRASSFQGTSRGSQGSDRLTPKSKGPLAAPTGRIGDWEWTQKFQVWGFPSYEESHGGESQRGLDLLGADQLRSRRAKAPLSQRGDWDHCLLARSSADLYGDTKIGWVERSWNSWVMWLSTWGQRSIAGWRDVGIEIPASWWKMSGTTYVDP